MTAARRPLLIDLFCGGGGAAFGYHLAGFDVIGVDIAPQPHYPFRFIRGDALDPPIDLTEAALVHASPVCKLYSQITRTAKVAAGTHPDQVGPIRELLQAAGVPYVIENVPGAPLIEPRLLCGSMFDLDVKRHRLFETNWALPDHHWPCRHKIWAPRYHPNRSDRARDPNARARVVSPAGGGGSGYGQRVADWRRAMEIDWLPRDALAQAIPPAYTRFVGEQFLRLGTAAA
jgi:DNA (cytosine-5)-methyltransferase 1